MVARILPSIKGLMMLRLRCRAFKNCLTKFIAETPKISGEKIFRQYVTKENQPDSRKKEEVKVGKNYVITSKSITNIYT